MKVNKNHSKSMDLKVDVLEIRRDFTVSVWSMKSKRKNYG